MTTRRIRPRLNDAVVDSGGRIKEPWQTYLDNLPNKSAKVDNLVVTPTVGQISTAFNDLLAKLKAAGMMED